MPFFKEFYSCLFSETDRSFSQKAYSIYQALCLPVSAQELLQANQLGGVYIITFKYILLFLLLSFFYLKFSIFFFCRGQVSDTLLLIVDQLSNITPHILIPHFILTQISYVFSSLKLLLFLFLFKICFLCLVTRRSKRI